MSARPKVPFPGGPERRIPNAGAEALGPGKPAAEGAGERVLLVVESPTRALALRRVVGPSVHVVATGGNPFGPRGRPRPGGGRILQELRDQGRRADRIVVATDRDREGEGIAVGLLGFLGPLFPGKVSRGYLEEGGPGAPGLGGPASGRPGAALGGGSTGMPVPGGGGRATGMSGSAGGRGPAVAVAAGGVDRGRAVARALREEADRRFLAAAGRILGGGGTCGRVQAAALERVVDRSREEPATWAVELRLEVGGERYRGLLGASFGTEEEAVAAAEGLGEPGCSRAIRRRRFEEPPPPPFDTGSLLAEADRLGLGPERVLEAARTLHRGVELADGIEPLLSYPRTDEAVLEADPRRPLAHGAIRPVAPEWTPERAGPYLGPAERKVYDRVFSRTAASRAAAAVLEGIEVDLGPTGRPLVARAVRVIEPGWRAVSGCGAEEPIPARGGGGEGRWDGTEDGHRVRVVRARAVERPGAGPFRPGELIADLAGRGIGRPSTWAGVARGLREAGWVRGDGGRLRATDEGRRVCRTLREALGPLAETATALEAGLRAVEEGRWRPEEFRRRFVRPLAEAGGAGRTPRCPKCGRPLLDGGTCSGFPVCRGSA
jgi:DNA topoisomerase IA